MRARPETLENRWDVLYRDYPEVYDEFSSFPYQPDQVDALSRDFDLKDKLVLDVGAGTGRSALKLARFARRVIAIEPEAGMRTVARRRTREARIANVDLVAGSGEALPIQDASVDVVTSVTAGIQSLDEVLRVLRASGLILSVDVTPGWYGGELNDVINDETTDAEWSRHLVEDWGFSYADFDCVQEYGTTENILGTYGFIFGSSAIEHLRRTGKTSIHWRFRVHYRYR